MVDSLRAVPLDHGELVVTPDPSLWSTLAQANRADAADWDFTVAGMPVALLRTRGRRELVAMAAEFSGRLGVPVDSPPVDPELVVATGHQPELYHPGVWVKMFVLQRSGEITGATAIDLVVDTDAFETVALEAPRLAPGVGRSRDILMRSEPDACFATTPVPTPSVIEEFCARGAATLASLPAAAPGRRFDEFCGMLRSSAGDACDLAELLTIARRRYEAGVGSRYLELPVSRMCGSAVFSRFAAHLLMNAEEFAACYNGALAAYRRQTNTRSTAQPFPDLRTDGQTTETPLWLIVDGRRRSTQVDRRDGRIVVQADGVDVCEFPADDGEKAAAALSEIRLAPKALVLTLFTRVLLADLFIHGMGGARYDQVTDDVIRSFFGVESPGYATTTLTLHLPLGAAVVTDDELAAAEDRLNRARHNPDAMLSEVEFGDRAVEVRAHELAVRKADLVSQIALPGADKKSMGAGIRSINEELGALIVPFVAELEAVLERLRAQRERADVLTDRTYSYCLWSPAEVADKLTF